MSKTHAEWVCNQAFRMPIKYILVTSQPMMDKVLRKMKHPPVPMSRHARVGAACHFFDPIDGNDARVCIVTCDAERNAHLESIELAAMLVHEAVHIVQEVMEIIGEKTPSSEFQAYLTQKVSLELFAEWVRQTGGGA